MPAISRSRVLASCVALVALLTALGACSKRSRGPMVPVLPVELIVRNRSYFDVVVYSVMSTAQSRARLATVTGGSEQRISVPGRNLQPGGMLRLYVHAIGSRSSWLSPAITVDRASVACLDVFAGPNGDVSRSALFTVPIIVPDTEPPPVADTTAAARAARGAGSSCSSLGSSD